MPLGWSHGMTHTKFHDSQLQEFKYTSRGCSLGNTDERDFLIMLLRWHDIHIKSHDDWFRNSSNIKGNSSAFWEAIVLVLQTRSIYDVCHWGGLHGMIYIYIYIYIYISDFMTIGVGIQATLRFCLRSLRGCSVGITDGRDLWYTYAVEIASCRMIYLPSFMKTGTAVQVILRFCLSNFKGCNVDITDGRDFFMYAAQMG
jgi:hypothetical protein